MNQWRGGGSEGSQVAQGAMAGGAHGFGATSVCIFLLLCVAKNVGREHHSLSGVEFSSAKKNVNCLFLFEQS